MSLEKQFDEVMMDIYRRAKTECNYTPSIFFRMLSDKRGVATAKQLINASSVSEGYTRLFKLGRLDLTVEAVIFDTLKWHELFTNSEIAKCKARLTDYNYFKK